MRTIVLILFVLLSVANLHGQNLTIATYNMRYDNTSDTLNAWGKRLPIIAQLVRFHDFDIFGGQELLSHQIEGLTKLLPEYGWFGVGRDDGKQQGEFSPIFYKKDAYTALRQGTFWLAPNSDVPGKGWDAALPRICSWGEFQEKKGKQKFFVFNTHFDHRGEQARVESARLILEKAKQIAGSAPVIVMGDFNSDQDSEGYKVLAASPLKDAFHLPKVKYANTSTFNSFDIRTGGDRRIDHLFLSPVFSVNKYGILTDSYQGKLPSDHYPVMIEVEWKKK
jgi:endonuclease/exonuclease/phosphatase family metal-dependent hydrolase